MLNVNEIKNEEVKLTDFAMRILTPRHVKRKVNISADKCILELKITCFVFKKKHVFD